MTEIVTSAKVNDQTRLQAAIIEAGNIVGVDSANLEADNGRPLGDSSNKLNKALQSPIAEPSTDRTRSTESRTGLQEQSGYIIPDGYYGSPLNLDSLPKSIGVHESVAAYIKAGTRTITSEIMLACANDSIACLREAIRKQITTNPNSLPLHSAARVLRDHTSDHATTVYDDAYDSAVMKAREELRGLRLIRGELPGVSSESAVLLYRRVYEEFSMGVARKDGWWSVSKVESYIGKQMGSRRFAMLQAAIGRGEAPLVQTLEPLVQDLAVTFTCFGDGPRWQADDVVTVIDGWLARNRGVYDGDAVDMC